jgi:hypothetical protein
MVAQPKLQQMGVGHSHPSVSGAILLLQSVHPVLHAYEQLRLPLPLLLMPQEGLVALFG